MGNEELGMGKEAAGSSEHRAGSTQHAARNQFDHAHTMLFDIYHRFTEGFDTRDLQETKTFCRSCISPIV